VVCLVKVVEKVVVRLLGAEKRMLSVLDVVQFFAVFFLRKVACFVNILFFLYESWLDFRLHGINDEFFASINMT